MIVANLFAEYGNETRMIKSVPISAEGAIDDEDIHDAVWEALKDPTIPLSMDKLRGWAVIEAAHNWFDFKPTLPMRFLICQSSIPTVTPDSVPDGWTHVRYQFVTDGKTALKEGDWLLPPWSECSDPIQVKSHRVRKVTIYHGIPK